MDRLPLLRTLLEHEQQRRDTALLHWREAQRQAEAAQEQADALVTYRSEYRQRWAAQFAKAAPIEIVRCYQGFVDRLEQAIGAQQSQVRGSAERLDAALQRLRHREMKLATVRRLIERRQQAHALLAQRRDQKACDEAAQRRPGVAGLPALAL
jgi:flagellar protein FliJ